MIHDEPGITGASSETVEWMQRLCRAAVRALSASGAGVSLMTEQGSHGVLAASDQTSQGIDELQFTLGEGPCLDAYATRQPVLAPSLEADAAQRWPAYAPAAHAQGIRAVFAFPLHIGRSSLGVLDVYRTRPGPLSAPAIAQAQSFAEVAMLSLLERQQNAGQAGAELEKELSYRAEVYQAQGMVLAQLGVDLDEAMVRLRAYAYAYDRPLRDVARDVLDGKLMIERDV